MKTSSGDDGDSPPSKSDDELARELALLGEDDIANAERFVRRFGHKVVYSETRGHMVCDGKRYRPNANLLCVELGKEVVTKIADELPFSPTKRREAPGPASLRGRGPKVRSNECWSWRKVA